MSFSADVKNELCGTFPSERCDMLAELFGIFMFSNQFSQREIRVSTSNSKIRDRISKMLNLCFNIDLEPIVQTRKYTFYLSDRAVISKILDEFGIDSHKNVSIRLNRALLEEECCREAFLRGAFFMGGSVSMPEKSYHLELVTSHYNLSREMMALLMDMDFDPKVTMRKSSYVLYFKYSEGIEDFLTKIGAPICAMQMMAAKVEKEVRNRINRQVNCETANITKTVDAAMIQLRAIEKLQQSDVYSSLPDDLKIVAKVRLEHPQMSLSQLTKVIDPPVCKATLNYRLKKLISLSEELK